MLDKYLDKAYQDVTSKTLTQIQYETAWTWTARACAAARLGKASDAREYAHEGLEHAALSAKPMFVDELRAVLASYGVVV